MKVLFIGGSKDGQRLEVGNAEERFIKKIVKKSLSHQPMAFDPAQAVLHDELYRREKLHEGGPLQQCYYVYVYNEIPTHNVMLLLLEGYGRAG